MRDERVILRRMAEVLCETRNRVLDQPGHREPCTHCTAQAALLLGMNREIVDYSEASGKHGHVRTYRTLT